MVYMHGCQREYLPPGVEDYGDLRAMTGAIHLLIGAGSPPGLTFSSPDSNTGAGGGVGDVTGSSGPSGPVGTSSVAGGGPNGGGGGGGKGGGGSLPFTGLEVGIVAAAGSALTAAGATLRRAVRRRGA